MRAEFNTLSVPFAAPDAANSVIAVDCAGEPEAEPFRLLVTNVGKDTLRSLDARLEGGLRYGPGKTRDAWVFNWKRKGDAVVWPVQADAKVIFDAVLVYDAPEAVQSRVVEGDAGKEKTAEQKGAGGDYAVECGDWVVQKTVRVGTSVKESLGRITLVPGRTEIRVQSRTITGGELFKLRYHQLTPVTAP